MQLNDSSAPASGRALVWFRRDLRDFDQAALFHALADHAQVFCAFIFDRDILDHLPRQDRRVEFLLASLRELDAALRAAGGGLIVCHARAVDAIPHLARTLEVDAVFANRDYEPAAVARDAAVAASLALDDIGFHLYKDQVIFERDEVLSLAGKSFS
ncbi:MAG: deoxyribodipyrimidine photo-lyase, partial [Pseudomonadota bacterium]|nr:deoxyribodipyrimidine photo-lyase [Pseudomonadota bacterium]